MHSKLLEKIGTEINTVRSKSFVPRIRKPNGYKTQHIYSIAYVKLKFNYHTLSFVG